MNDTQAIEITPGEHPTREFLGMTFNIDTIASTLVAGAIVVVVAFWAKRKLTETNEDHVPTKIQLAWEYVVTEVTTQVESNLGRVNPFVVPLAAAGGEHPATDLERRARPVRADRRRRHRPEPEVLGHQVHLEVTQHARVDQDGRGVLVRDALHGGTLACRSPRVNPPKGWHATA